MPGSCLPIGRRVALLLVVLIFGEIVLPIRRRPILNEDARIDPSTARLPAVEPRTDPFPVVRLDVPDERTPLYDALYAIHGLGGRHHLNPHREAPMPRHADFDGDGQLDHLQQNPPTQSAEPPDDHDYVYTDPVDDPSWTRISEPTDEDPDAFPQGWSSEPTERDQAAIDAGNA